MIGTEMDYGTLAEIIEYVPIGILILDPEGRVVMMNKWQEEISGVNREKILGSFFHHKWARLFRQGIMTGYWDLLKNGKPFDETVHEIHPQFYNRKISAISRGLPLPGNKGFILLHEVSEEMKRNKQGIERLKDKLAEAHNFLVNVVDSSPNIVITTGKTEKIRTVNLTGESKFGYTERELVGKKTAALFADPVSLEDLMEHTSEVTCVRKDRSSFPARVQVRNVFTKTGKFQAKLLILADITWEKQMEEKLALSQKLAIYSELMAGIAHQINNPLVGVVNFSSLLLDRAEPESDIYELAETINSAAQKCRDMLASLIKGIREPQSSFIDLDIGDVLKSALCAAQEQEPEISSKSTVEMQLSRGLKEVRGDYLQLLETFRNLVVNAFQAMPHGGKIIISADNDPANKTVEIQIADSGPGIQEPFIAKVFEPFFSTKKGKGAGLGLSFAYQVVKSHGGRIEVQSGSLKGACFKIGLPYTRK